MAAGFLAFGIWKENCSTGITCTATLLEHTAEHIVFCCLLEKHFQSQESHMQWIWPEVSLGIRIHSLPPFTLEFFQKCYYSSTNSKNCNCALTFIVKSRMFQTGIREPLKALELLKCLTLQIHLITKYYSVS